MNDEIFAKVVKESGSIRQVLLTMGLVPAGGNYLTVKRRIMALRLDTKHFWGQGHLKGKKNTWHPKASLPLILVAQSGYKGGTSRLKKRLLDERLLERKCYECGLTEWKNQPIPLELEHKNGNNTDNRLENLTLLCPNCHALTPTYRAKNMKPRWWNRQTHSS
jgi:hypothetical protein